jgi:four helix bundle protein
MSYVRTQNYNSNLKSSNLRLRSYKFSLDIIAYTSKFPEKRIYWVIGDQLLRSATSIGANIIEAKASSSKREFVKYYEIALKSANETNYWLNLIKDSNLISENITKILISEIVEICKMLGSSILTLKGKKISSY